MKKHSTVIRNMTACALMTALICVCSWITIPGPVPFTMQTFAIFFALMTLGGKWGTLSVALYLAIGTLGLPVFSGFTGGVGKILGATGGYLVGFLPMAALYWLLVRVLGTGRLRRFIAAALSMIFLYACGTIWFYVVYVTRGETVTILAILSACVFSFIPLDALKIALAAFLSDRLKKAGIFQNRNTPKSEE